MSLTIAELMEKSLSRGQRWHEADQPWKIADWGIAMTGEGGELAEAVLKYFQVATATLEVLKHAGEAGNAIKKLRRIETAAPNINDPGRQIYTLEAAKQKIGQEVADMILYVPQLVALLDIDLERALCETFNAKSIEYGFPERLGEKDAQP